MLGINDDYAVFDQDLIIHANMAFNTLTQIGVGPATGFVIKDASDKWTDFIGTDIRLEMVKMYVYLKVKRLFDSGTPGSLNDAIDNQIKELEWRISVQVDPGEETQDE